MSDYIYSISTWSQPQLVEKAIASLLPDEEYVVQQCKGFSSLAAAWNDSIKKYVMSDQYKAVILMGDDVECEDPRPTGRALLGVLEKYGAILNVIMTVGYDVNLFGNKGLTAMPGSLILPGANCMCITKRLVEEVGLYDERYKRAWFEDTDMWQRIYQRGYEVANVAPIRHVGAATTMLDSEAAEAKLKYYPENYQKYIKKWGGPPGQEKNPTSALRNDYVKK
jgi:hypothetical protein